MASNHDTPVGSGRDRQPNTAMANLPWSANRFHLPADFREDLKVLTRLVRPQHTGREDLSWRTLTKSHRPTIGRWCDFSSSHLFRKRPIHLVELLWTPQFCSPLPSTFLRSERSRLFCTRAIALSCNRITQSATPITRDGQAQHCELMEWLHEKRGQNRRPAQITWLEWVWPQRYVGNLVVDKQVTRKEARLTGDLIEPNNSASRGGRGVSRFTNPSHASRHPFRHTD